MMGKGLIADGTVDSTYANTPYRGWRLSSQLPAKSHKIEIVLHTERTSDPALWENDLAVVLKEATQNLSKARKNTQKWWNDFWEKSYIRINEKSTNDQSKPWQVGRNYQLFRYQLGCNAFGEYPTKFNGGLFTFDPVFVDSSYRSTPISGAGEEAVLQLRTSDWFTGPC
jgi:hypothetical protein